MTAAILTLALAGCQTVIQPPTGSDVVQRDGVMEILQRRDADPPVQPICLVRARFFRGLVGVPCASLAQEIRP